MCDVLDAYFLQLNLFLKMCNKRNKIKPFSIRVFIQIENHLMFAQVQFLKRLIVYQNLLLQKTYLNFNQY